MSDQDPPSCEQSERTAAQVDPKAVAAVPFMEQVRSMKWNFWVANLIESVERLAFFGVRAVLPLYMVETVGGGLGLSYTQKGVIYGVWALIQCLVPMVSGGYTDSYGYKRSMYVAFAINILGYSLMANVRVLYDGVGLPLFWGMMAAACLVGLGTAIFKPPVQGMVAKSLNEGNSSLGFGIFYFLVNVGGLIAPMAAAALRGNEAAPTWAYVFYGAAVVTAVNFLPTILLFREPEIQQAERDKSPVQVFADSMRVLWHDQPMLRFLLVVSGFWFMFMQLWDLLPNFIAEWVDTRDVGAFLAMFPGGGSLLDASGGAKPEMLINIDAFAIVLLVIPLSWLSGRFKMFWALMVGMLIATVGFVGAGMTAMGWATGFMIFVFAIGEIICSPKFSEYIGMTAPPDKKALYMGYSNIPFAIGWAVGNWLSGPLYDAFSSKEVLARAWLLDHGVDADQVAAIEELPELMDLMVAQGAGADTFAATALLWEAHAPWVIWPMLGAVGLISVVGMWLNYRAALKRRARSDRAALAPSRG